MIKNLQSKNMTNETEERRDEIIKEIQAKRNSKFIAYVVSTRDGVGFHIADDVIRVIYDHLTKLKGIIYLSTPTGHY